MGMAEFPDLGRTFSLFGWESFPTYDQAHSCTQTPQHVFQVARNDIVNNGMAPEAAEDKALKRAQEIFAKYPIPQT